MPRAISLWMFAFLLPATGCIPVVTSAVISGSEIHKESRRTYLVQTQALRLNSGLSWAEFNAEMFAYVGSEYYRALFTDLTREARRRLSTADRKKYRTHVSAILKFPDLRTRYDNLLRDRDALVGEETYWSMKTMLYRAARLSEGVPEDVVISELIHSDVEFASRHARMTGIQE